MSKYRITRSYDYNALCDVCKIQFKASELRLRWDRLMVCKDDWEIRHPSDFYRTRNDAHKLPFIRSSDGPDPELTWVPTIANLSYTLADLETGTTLSASSPTGYYVANALSGQTRATFGLPFFVPSFSDSTKLLPVREALSTTTSTGVTVTLPTTPGGSGTATVVNDRGERIATATVTSGNTTVTFGSWTKKRGGLTFSFLYTT